MNAVANTVASASYLIPLTLLVASPRNVRKTGGENVDALVASIQSLGLLQNLTVVPKGKKYEVIAGGRRLRALQQLRKVGAIDASYEVRCEVRTVEEATEISTAENVVREAMHPADQFDAFKTMADAGAGIEDIAAKFGVSTLVVRQRMKLAQVAPEIVKDYRQGKATLEQLMALAITDDHTAQIAVWSSAVGYHRQPDHLRNALTGGQLPARDKLVKFVTLAAYEQAGGVVTRDLFGDDSQSFIADTALLNRMVAERLETEAAALRADGWGWVEVRESWSYEESSQFVTLEPATRTPTDEEAQRLEALNNRIQDLYDSGDDESEDDGEELERLEAEAEALEATFILPVGDAEKAMAGAVVAVGHDGSLMKITELVRRADAKAVAAARAGGDDNTAGAVASTKKPIGVSAALLAELTSARTQALRAKVAGNSAVALVATVHTLVLSRYFDRLRQSTDSLLAVTARDTCFIDSMESLTGTRAATELAASEAAAKAGMPDDAALLWDWLASIGTDRLLALLAVCVAPSIDAVAKFDGCKNGNGKLVKHSDGLAVAVGLDMADYWTATAASYLASVPKALIAEAVTEAVSAEAGKPLEGMKKADAAQAAETLLAGTRWIPGCIR